MADPNTVDWYARTFGAVGTFLGVWNAFVVPYRNRVRLRVVPKCYGLVEGGGALTWTSVDNELGVRPSGLCIEVTNLSSTPVTISEVGFISVDTKKRLVLIAPTLFRDGRKFPHRLEARTSETFYEEPGSFGSGNLRRMRKAYVTTDCGITATGTSDILRKLQKGGT